jgi:hypothetical protein
VDPDVLDEADEHALPEERPAAPVPRMRTEDAQGSPPASDGQPGGVRAVGAGGPRTMETEAPWAEKLVRFLDDGIRVPGTDFRFGLDAIIGFFLPGVGDFATGAGAMSLLVLAIRERVPTVVIGRMVVNIGIDTLLGTVPMVGDLFDLFFKANRKNLELIEKYRDDPEAEPSFGDYALVAAGALLILISIAVPLILVLLIGGGLWSLFE